MAMLIGDIHGEVKSLIDFIESNQKYCIQLGDFGLIFSETKDEKYILEYLEYVLKIKDKYIFTILGNHENYDFYDTLPETTFNGTRVKKYTDHIMAVCRGEILALENKTFLCIGGADSHDKEWRMEYEKTNKEKIWWEQEIISEDDIQNAYNNLELFDGKVDFILSHTPPACFCYQIYRDGAFSKSELLLEQLLNVAEFDTWYCAHVHTSACKSLGESAIVSLNIDETLSI